MVVKRKPRTSVSYNLHLPNHLSWMFHRHLTFNMSPADLVFFPFALLFLVFIIIGNHIKACNAQNHGIILNSSLFLFDMSQVPPSLSLQSLAHLLTPFMHTAIARHRILTIFHLDPSSWSHSSRPVPFQFIPHITQSELSTTHSCFD